MGPYTAAKSGVEALTDALRMETAPSGARVGCAYFGFIDTDLVRASLRAALDRSDERAACPASCATPRRCRRRSTRSSRASNGAPRACGPRAGWARLIALRGLAAAADRTAPGARTRAPRRGDAPVGARRRGESGEDPTPRRRGGVQQRRRGAHSARENSQIAIDSITSAEHRDDGGLEQRGHVPAPPGHARVESAAAPRR